MDAFLEANGFTLQNHQFTFEARQVIDGEATGTPIQAFNDADGNISFTAGNVDGSFDGEEIVFDISQANIATKMFDVDPITARVHVEAKDNGNGTMVVEVSSIEYMAVGDGYDSAIAYHEAATERIGGNKAFFVNSYGISLPLSGMDGIAAFAIIGGLLVLLGSILVYESNRRKKETSDNQRDISM